MNKRLQNTLLEVASFFDKRKVGDQGPLGFRRSTDLSLLLRAIQRLKAMGLFEYESKSFLDLGCADGRVVVLMSYLCKLSVGIEIDDLTVDEYKALRKELDRELVNKKLLLPDGNIFLFHGDALSNETEEKVKQKISYTIRDFDIFYTYLVMHEEFSKLIVQKAKKGAQFWLYGISNIIPKYTGMRLLTGKEPLEGILVVYEKI